MLVTGTITDGTSMTTLQLKTDSGNLLYINTLGANIKVNGGLKAGKRVTVEIALQATNISEQ